MSQTTQPTPIVTQPPSLLNPYQELPTVPMARIDAHNMVGHAPAMPAATVAKITTAICKVMSEVGIIEKAGTNEFFRYKFVQMQDVLQTLTPLMAKHGIAVLQTEVERTLDDQGKAMAIKYEFMICHNSGEVWPKPLHWTGSAVCRNRNGSWDDKAISKCATAARKYCLLSIFNIPTGDQDDADRGENDGGNLAGSVGGQYGLGDPVSERVLAAGQRDREASQTIYDGLRTELSTLEESGASPDGLKQWGGDQGERINKLVSEHYDPFRKFFGDVLERSKAKYAKAKVGGLVGPDDPAVQEVKAAKGHRHAVSDPGQASGQAELSNDDIAELLEKK